MANSNVPGVYGQVENLSLAAATAGQFACGLVGPASRGPFNSAVVCNSLGDFITNFGPSISGSYLSFAVAAITSYSGGVAITRVGRQYTAAIGQASGTSGTYNLFSSNATNVAGGQYLQVSQVGKHTTVNAQVQSVSIGTVALTSIGAAAVALADNYTAAAVLSSTTSAAASSAETLLQAPVYGTLQTSIGSVTGTKSAYSFTVSGNASLLAAGSVIKIVQSGASTTREAVVSSVAGSTVYLATTTNTATGQQAVALQDNYTSGGIYIQTGAYTNGVFLQAATPGTWANSTGAATSGLVVNVSPGTAQDTKKLLIFLNGVLVEAYDNLDYLNTTSPNYWVTALAGDNYVTVRDSTLIAAEPPANTLAPWNIPTYPVVNVATFSGGFDGANIQDSDIVGTLDVNGNPTGLFVFRDPRTWSSLYLLAAPGYSDPAVYQALASTAGVINARSLSSAPAGLTLQQATDWRNGQGAYAGSNLNNYRGSFYWNWFMMADPFTGTPTLVPPEIEVLGAIANTFSQNKMFQAAAGEQWGTCPDAVSVQYPRVTQGALDGAFANSVINPILLYSGNTILIWGESSALTVATGTVNMLQSNVVVDLVNYLMKNLTLIARRYIFQPNDAVVVSQLNTEINGFMQTVKGQRGISNYDLSFVQTAVDINNRDLTINLSIIPIPPLYRINLNIIVNSAGATLSTTPTTTNL